VGLARGALALLLEEALQRPFSGTVATLGKQTILVGSRELEKLFAQYGVAMAREPGSKREIDDQDVMLALGFSEARSLDYSDYEGATDVVDLNTADLPAIHKGRYDVVLDSGTIEHVFHVPNVLKNIFDMLKPGGRVIFLAPSSNHMDHGFYMFSPTFFYDYYAANGFVVEKACVVRYNVDLSQLWYVYDYVPGAWLDLSLGGLDNHPYAIFFVATKAPGARWDVIPQQGYYSRTNAAYAGSRLADGDRAPAATAPAEAVVAPPAAEPITPSPISSPLPDPRLRAIARRIPGARRVYRAARRGWMMMAALRPSRGRPNSGPYILHGKPLRGRF
jgi:SAM-dependent methyltransferase